MLLLIERILNKVVRSYRELCFQRHIRQKIIGLKIYGEVTLINYNVKAGRNLKLYPGVMIYGDGPIVIGNNVDIGNGTILYASKQGGVLRLGMIQ